MSFLCGEPYCISSMISSARKQSLSSEDVGGKNTFRSSGDDDNGKNRIHRRLNGVYEKDDNQFIIKIELTYVGATPYGKLCSLKHYYHF